MKVKKHIDFILSLKIKLQDGQKKELHFPIFAVYRINNN